MRIKVLDKGYIELIQYMGDDLTVVNAARASYKRRSDPAGWYCTSCGDEQSERPVNGVCKGCGQYVAVKLHEKDARLLAFLGRENHTMPLRHVQITVEVRAPIFVARQWWRHAIGAATVEEGTAWSEMSRRYVTEDPEVYMPLQWRSAPENKKQGSGEPLDEVQGMRMEARYRAAVDKSLATYRWMIEHGLAPEQARSVLPNGLYTTWWWSPSAHAVINFLQLRLAPDAQAEIREYAEALLKIVRPLWPATLRAFGVDHAS